MHPQVISILYKIVVSVCNWDIYFRICLKRVISAQGTCGTIMLSFRYESRNEKSRSHFAEFLEQWLFPLLFLRNLLSSQFACLEIVQLPHHPELRSIGPAASSENNANFFSRFPVAATCRVMTACPVRTLPSPSRRRIGYGMRGSYLPAP